jgi:hypothetical protein
MIGAQFEFKKKKINEIPLKLYSIFLIRRRSALLLVDIWNGYGDPVWAGSFYSRGSINPAHRNFVF